MKVEKKIIGWEIFMSVLFAVIVCFALINAIFFKNNLKPDLSDFLVTFAGISSVLFGLIYFVMPQPFRVLLLKAKDTLSKKDFIYFSIDQAKTKIPTNWMHISSKVDKGIQDHFNESQLELNPEELELLRLEHKKKTRYANFVIFLNVGSWSIYLFLLISIWGKSVFVENNIFLFGCILLVFLYLRYTHNTFILLQFNKKLNQIQETPDIKYLDIRDLYEELLMSEERDK